MKKSKLLYKLWLLALAATLSWQSVPTFAQTPAANEEEGLMLTQEEYDRVIHNNFSGKDPAQACTSPDSEVIVTGKNDADVYRFLVGKGLTPVQTSAIIGNFKAESTPNIDPNAINSSSGAYGIAQWLHGRKDALMAFAAEKGQQSNTLSIQLEYFWYEITETNEKAALEALREDGDNLEAATETWARRFERPSESEIQESLAKRINWARQALAQFGGLTFTPDNPRDDSGCLSTGGISIVDGLAFPLQTTKAAILNNNPKWCHNRQENCHHNYNAADIFVPTGTTVIAAKNGVVVYTQNGTAANVVIKGVDNNIYYYTHMGPETVVVKTGDSVTAGQKLGTVGTSADAQGTPPHLHFDILPPPHEVRMACSGAACNTYPFINVQPGLTKAYEGLP